MLEGLLDGLNAVLGAGRKLCGGALRGGELSDWLTPASGGREAGRKPGEDDDGAIGGGGRKEL